MYHIQVDQWIPYHLCLLCHQVILVALVNHPHQLLLVHLSPLDHLQHQEFLLHQVVLDYPNKQPCYNQCYITNIALTGFPAVPCGPGGPGGPCKPFKSKNNYNYYYSPLLILQIVHLFQLYQVILVFLVHQVILLDLSLLSLLYLPILHYNTLCDTLSCTYSLA